MVRDAVDAAQYTEVYEAMKILSKEDCKRYGDELKRALTSHIEIVYKRDSYVPPRDIFVKPP